MSISTQSQDHTFENGTISCSTAMAMHQDLESSAISTTSKLEFSFSCNQCFEPSKYWLTPKTVRVDESLDFVRKGIFYIHYDG